MAVKAKKHKALSNPLVVQLHRIAGQLTAVERMLSGEKGERSDKQVLMLLDAAINSLRSLRNAFIKEQIRGKLASELETLLDMVDK